MNKSFNQAYFHLRNENVNNQWEKRMPNYNSFLLEF
jgi:hypothetical protein